MPEGQTEGEIPPSQIIDLMSITVVDREEVNNVYYDISGFEVDDYKMLRIRRRDIVVVVFNVGDWSRIELEYKFRDGSVVNDKEMKGVPESVGLGVEVTAIGGRTK